MKDKSSKAPEKPGGAKGTPRPSPHGVEGMLRHLHEFTKEQWTPSNMELWKQFVDALFEAELQSLCEHDVTESQAKKLIRRAWARWDPETGDIIAENEPPKNPASAVPVVLVYRDGGFAIHAGIHHRLYAHPLLPEAREESPDRDDRAGFIERLKEVELISEKELGSEQAWRVAGMVPEHDGLGRRVATCGSVAYRLRCLLHMGHLNDGSEEELEWLERGWNGKRLWRLLNTAIHLGETMERRRILDDLNGEEVMRRMITAPPGKNTGEVGSAIEDLVECFRAENGSLPTAAGLLEWMGGKRSPKSDGDPLEVDHPLWKGALLEVSWTRFQDHVKEAKGRLKRRGQ